MQFDDHLVQGSTHIDKIVEQFQLKEVPWKDIKGFDIKKRCKLEELSEEVNSEFKIGSTFCEFKDELETLPGRTKVIFMKEVMTILTDERLLWLDIQCIIIGGTYQVFYLRCHLLKRKATRWNQTEKVDKTF